MLEIIFCTHPARFEVGTDLYECIACGDLEVDE